MADGSTTKNTAYIIALTCNKRGYIPTLCISLGALNFAHTLLYIIKLAQAPGEKMAQGKDRQLIIHYDIYMHIDAYT
jgi:hypothetical protein